MLLNKVAAETSKDSYCTDRALVYLLLKQHLGTEFYRLALPNFLDNFNKVHNYSYNVSQSLAKNPEGSKRLKII